MAMGNQQSTPDLKSSPSTANLTAPSSSAPSPKKSSRPYSGKKYVKIGQISVYVVKGRIQDEKADVIVNCAAADLDLSKGRTTSALSRAAGKSLQDECNEKYEDGINEGEVAVTRGGNLRCNRVYHLTLPQWEEGGEGAIKQAVENVLTEAQNHGVKSIASPPMGTGYLNYSPDVIAAQMFQAVADFVQNTPSTTINKFTIVVFTANAFKSVYQALTTEARRIAANSTSSFKRGSKEYFQDLYKQQLYPPSYWTHYDDSKSLQDWNTEASGAKLVMVDQATQDAVTNLVAKTWKGQFVGLGRDAQGLDKLKYKNIKIKNIERVENPVLFEKYAQTRADMFRKAGKIGSLKKLENISCVQEGPVLTTLNCEDALQQDMFPEVNEHYLFHGTSLEKVDVITSQGLDCRLASKPVLGNGVYAAESATKADQYADPVDKRDKDGDKKMFLLRMCLGEIFVLETDDKFEASSL